MALSPRERVLMAVRGERPDRTPRDFWAETPALARVLERWVAHLLGVRVAIEPVQRIDDARWRWHVGLDSEATALLNDLYEGRPVDEARQRRLLSLFRLEFADPAEHRGFQIGIHQIVGIELLQPIEFLDGTPYGGCDVVVVSARDGRGLDELLAALDRAAGRAEAGRAHTAPRHQPTGGCGLEVFLDKGAADVTIRDGPGKVTQGSPVAGRVAVSFRLFEAGAELGNQCIPVEALVFGKGIFVAHLGNHGVEGFGVAEA